MTERQTYKGRGLHIDNLIDTDLQNLLFDHTPTTLSSWQIYPAAQADWCQSMATGKIPHVDRFGNPPSPDQAWHNWEEFEAYLLTIVRELASDQHHNHRRKTSQINSFRRILEKKTAQV